MSLERAYDLPLLPGLSASSQLGQTRFHKSQGLVFQNQVPTLLVDAPGIGGQKRAVAGVTPPRSSTYPKQGDGPAQPAWLAFDRKVLNFEAYFQEAVSERRDEQSRVRRCKIYFYLEDDTMQIVEPVVPDSGLPQGTLVRRHRIPKPAPHDDQFYIVDDFNVGNELTIYGRVFTLYACDAFTRDFLTKLGVRVGEDGALPTDSYSQTRKALKDSMQPFKPFERHDTLGKFLEYDGKVLRFYTVWDDTESTFGDRRYFVLHYYLADDTASLHEILSPNSGRDGGSAFVRRQKIPKDVSGVVKHPGQATPRTVLNVFGPTLSGRHILDNLRTGSLSDAFYTDADLTIGAVIDVFGRRMLLCDCDVFTKEYYSLKYNITEFTPIQLKDDAGQPISTELPPYNGFGTEEDSLQSCLSLMPQPPRPAAPKHLTEPTGLERALLRFEAKMDTVAPEDVDRRFIVSYYLSDDTVSVFEQRQRNSGQTGGKFMERVKVKTADNTRYVDAHDFVVGQKVQLRGWTFVLLGADDFAYNFMYEHKFPESDPARIVARLKAQAGGRMGEAVAAVKKAASGDLCDGEKFSSALRHAFGQAINAQNIRALLRAYSADGEPSKDAEAQLVVHQLQSVLAKKNYNNFSNINKAFLHYDKERRGTLSKAQIKAICLQFNLPVDDALLDAVIAHMPANAAGGIDYHAFSKSLDYTTTPALQQSHSYTSAAAENLSTTLRSVVHTSRDPQPSHSISVAAFESAFAS